MLAALLKPTGGTVTAFERDPERFKTLKRMLNTARAKCASASGRGPLSSQLSDTCTAPSWRLIQRIRPTPMSRISSSTQAAVRDVGAVIVLTRSAGSGIVSRMDALTSSGTGPDHARLKSLSGFQTAILSHAMRFTSARRIVYSTCSVHEQENEQVVERVLRKPEFADWSIAPRADVLPTWPHRGVDGYGTRDAR